MTNTCACGCGKAVCEGRTFLRGHNRRGTTRSENTRAKASAAMRGFRHSDATKAKMRAAVRKRRSPMTSAEREKHSAAMLGKNRVEGPTFTSEGRALVLAPEHPATNADGRVVRARYVLEQKIGRLLQPNELPHHINLDPSDDHPDNLMAMDRAEHTRWHHLIRRLGIEDHFKTWLSRAEREAA